MSLTGDGGSDQCAQRLRPFGVAPAEIVEDRDPVRVGSDGDAVSHGFVDRRCRHPVRIEVAELRIDAAGDRRALVSIVRSGRTTAASDGPSLPTPTSGLMTLPAWTSWSYCRMIHSLLHDLSEPRIVLRSSCSRSAAGARRLAEQRCATAASAFGVIHRFANDRRAAVVQEAHREICRPAGRVFQHQLLRRLELADGLRFDTFGRHTATRIPSTTSVRVPRAPCVPELRKSRSRCSDRPLYFSGALFEPDFRSGVFTHFADGAAESRRLRSR